MSQYNIANKNDLETNYLLGLLPQRNSPNLFYFDSSSRSNLTNFQLSSENRRILRKTENFSFTKTESKDFDYTLEVQKQIFNWIKQLGWDFPISSVKNIFTKHLFNYIYVWKNEKNEVIAYSICLFTKNISHVAYVFYNSEYSHGNLPIRLVLQVIIDSQELGLKYCYLGRFSQFNGFYKRNMPGFEYFEDNNWVTL